MAAGSSPSRRSIVVAVVAVFGSAFLGIAAVEHLSGQSADAPLLEAVIRYEIGAALRNSSTSAPDGPSIFCVQTRASARRDPADPDSALLARFQNHRPPVRPGSACDVKDWKVYERSTGGTALIIDVGPVVRRTRTRADVSGAPYAGGPIAREYLYKLKWTGKQWVVYEAELKIAT